MKPHKKFCRPMPCGWLRGGALVISGIASCLIVFSEARSAEHQIVVTVNRGQDVGQSFGSLFELTSSDGTVVMGAGFQNLYNTRYRADRHSLQFFVRPANGKRTHVTETLPRPNELCGTYLFSRDEVIHSTYGGLKVWNPQAAAWQSESSSGGTDETMRIGDKLLVFGDSEVTYADRKILDPPQIGNYQLFFYANGHLCFYHVNRGEGGYRPFTNDKDGFSKLCACPWTSDQSKVDLSRAVILNLPIVGETTFAWGQLGEQIVTGSNVGGFYVFKDGRWQILLPPQLGVSYQLYSTMAFHDQLLMGHYPTGRIFQYDGTEITDQPGWPPVLEGVSSSAREAQTTVVYGGDVFAGVWPWGELWRYNPDTKTWTFTQRMFDHPSLASNITHPYDMESIGADVSNQWGQRVTSLVPSGTGLFISTSAKSPREWDPQKFPFLAPDKWKSYGNVYKLTIPGHLSAATKWTEGPTTFEFLIRGSRISVRQDGEAIAETELTGPLSEQVTHVTELTDIRWGQGIYGRFSGSAINGSVAKK